MIHFQNLFPLQKMNSSKPFNMKIQILESNPFKNAQNKLIKFKLIIKKLQRPNDQTIKKCYSLINRLNLRKVILIAKNQLTQFQQKSSICKF